MKKPYTAPKLVELGGITELTQGNLATGNADSFLGVTYGISG